MKKSKLRFIIAVILVISMLFQQFSAAAEGIITVDPQTGLASQYNYLQFDAGTAGTLYVNQYKTKSHVRRSDLTLGGNRMPVEIEFWYDEENLSNDLTADANPYGYGWMTGYNQLLEYQSLNEKYAWRNANGTWIYFEDSGEVTGEDASIWEEVVATEEATTGAVLYLEDEALPSSYTDVTITWEDYNYTFDAIGRLSSVSDAYGNTLFVTYSLQTGPAISVITDGVGRRYAFSYTNGWLSSITCQDGAGIAITILNTPIAVSYTITNGLLEETSLGANYSYDSCRRITSLWGQDGIGCTVTYNGNAQEVTSVTKQAAMGTAVPLNGSVTEISRTNDEVTITEDSLEEVLTYDVYGRPLTVEVNELTEDHGITTSELLYGITYIYENVLQPDGTIVNQLTDIQFYDGEEQQSLEGGEGGSVNTEPETEPEPGEGEGEGEPDPEEPEEDPFSYTETRDQYGNILSETGSIGNLSQTTIYTYSSDGNYLTSVTNEDGIVTTYSYNSLTGILESVTDGLSHTTSYMYNALRELTVASLPVTGLVSGSSMSASYTYEDGRISTVSYGGFVYSFSYDAWGNITQVQMNNSPLVSYYYGTDPSLNQVQSLTYGNGQAVYYSYNDAGQIASVSYTGQTDRFCYRYTSDGELQSIRDDLTGQATLYLEDGIEIWEGLNLLYSMTYSDTDEDTLLKSIFGTSYIHTSSSDDLLNNQTIQSQTVLKGVSGLYSDSVIRDGLGRTVSKLFSDGTNEISQNYTYKTTNGSTGNLISAYDLYSDGEEISGHYQYTYDGNGNITAVQRSFSQDELILMGNLPGGELNGGDGPIQPPAPIYQGLWDISGTESYTYDEAGQLKTAGYSDGRSYSYTYDSAGNIITNQKNIPSTDSHWSASLLTYSYNQKKQMTGYVDSVTLRSVSYTLDQMGNPVSIIAYEPNNTTIETDLTWGEGRMLTGLELDDVSTYTYVYNADGLRIQKIYEYDNHEYTTDYIWADGHLLAERRADGTVITILYDCENSPAGFLLEKTVGGITTVEQYSYLKNLQGDITHIIDEDGETVTVYRYDPWGDWAAEGDTDLAALNPCTYRGYYRDEETGWYYLQSRFYNPEIGRFLNADDPKYISLSNGFIGYNIYAYCNNNPVMNIDTDGFFSIPTWVVTAGLDAAILLLANFLKLAWAALIAPIKTMGKNAACAFFSKYLVGKFMALANTIGYWGATALSWIGQKAFAVTFNIGVKAAMSAITREPMRIITACLSIGGLLAALADYISDKKFDGWIRLW